MTPKHQINPCKYGTHQITRKINQPTIQSYLAKALNIEIEGGLLITTLFLEIKMKRFLQKMASSLSFYTNNPKINIVQENEATNIEVLSSPSLVLANRITSIIPNEI